MLAFFEGGKVIIVSAIDKGSAPRAAPPARLAHGSATTKCDGGSKQRPMIWCD